MQVKLETFADHVRLTIGGVFDAAEARKLIAEVLHASRETGVERILIDAREVASRVSIADRYLLAMHLAAQARAPFRMAIVGSEKNAFTKTLEDTATNRNLAVRTTTSMREACDYLGIGPLP